jgi:hypothetical protein
MKSSLMILILCFFGATFFIQAQNSDQISGSAPIVAPENIQSLVEQITIAENNGNWEEYARLREEIIQSWQKVNPEVAKLYSNSNSGVADLTADGSPVGNNNLFNDKPADEEYEQPLETEFWGEDVMITDGRSFDISMDINRSGDIYIAVNGRKDGSSPKDSVFVYKSTDGGATWTEWGFIWLIAGTLEFEQIELMCFDHPSGSEAYILLFYRFDNGRLRVGRRDMDTPGAWSYYTIVSEGVIDFAVDRNYSISNYRAICVYDSSNRIYSTRSEPSSYGTVWQDKVHINGLVGKDVDFAYGWNGAVYTTFNGFNTGNLYVIENINYADPSSWGSQYTVAQGSVDTTRHAEIIASREDDPNNKVIVVFEKREVGPSWDLYDATRDNNVWTAYNTWVVPNENKYPSISVEYSVSPAQDFKGAFVQSPVGNLPPRIIKYKGYSGTTWSESLQMSDAGNDPTGLQKPEVGSLSGSVTIIAYAGSNYSGVYFDREDWVNDVQLADNKTPDSYSLSQNYPNPFNPSTTIKYSVPDLSNVSLKIYNLVGQEVAELVNKELQSGNYEVTFDAVNLPSGVYFYRLQAGNFVDTKKMLLLR